MPQPRFSPTAGYDEMSAKSRVRAVVRALARTFGQPRTWLHYRNAFELLIATIMSAQTTDDMVNSVTPELFKRYPTPQKLAGARPATVEKIITSTGFYRQKTKSIIGTARRLVEAFDGEVPQTIEELTTCPGVARKTANVVLSNAFPNSDHGIFVDTHIRRVSQRLGFTPNEDPVKIEQDLMALLPRSRWVDVPHQMILLGRGPCDARRPQHDQCPLLKWCPSGQEALGLGDAPQTRRAAEVSIVGRSKAKRRTTTKAKRSPSGRKPKARPPRPARRKPAR